MTEKTYQSKFEKVTGANQEGANIDEGELEEWVPRVNYDPTAAPDLSRIVVPRLRLAQGLTPEVTAREANVGQFVCTNYAAMDSVTIIPFIVQSIREYKPEPKQPPVCFSPDGVHGFGVPAEADSVNGLCANCPLSKWGKPDPKTGRSRKPPCADGISLRAYSVEHRGMIDFRFMGGAADQGTFLIQMAMVEGWCGFAVKLKSTTQKNDKGEWFVPQVTLLELEKDIPEKHRATAEKWYDVFIASLNQPALPATTV